MNIKTRKDKKREFLIATLAKVQELKKPAKKSFSLTNIIINFANR